MSHFGLKINKTESPDKTPYTIYYPHTIPSTERQWNQPYYQVVSIDPARKNYAIRIERRYHAGRIEPIVFNKESIESYQMEGDTSVCYTYQQVTAFLDKYEQFYDDCHFIIIERQLPQNYKATRIAQHSISYFSIKLKNKPLLPSIVEIDPKLKGKLLGAPKGINDRQLKSWSVEKGRELCIMREDDYSLGVLNHFKNKQDDLCDTICQIEALFICWGLPITKIQKNQVEPSLGCLTKVISDNTIKSNVKILNCIDQTANLKTSNINNPTTTLFQISSSTPYINPPKINLKLKIKNIDPPNSKTNEILNKPKPLTLKLIRNRN